MKILEINTLKKEFNRKVDYFICCASFEERCLVIANNIDTLKICNSILCFNEDQASTFHGFETELKNILSATNPVQLKLNSNNPLVTASIFKEHFDDINNFNEKIFLIDITTFTHEALLILFRLLNLKGVPNENIFYAYNNASDYSIKEKDLNQKWLSAGVKEIRSIIGFSGFLSPLKKNLLIVLVGFEPERTIKIITKYQPDLVALGVGLNHSSDNPSSVLFNKSVHKQILSEVPNAITFEFDVTSPELIIESISSEINKYSGMNIIIAPMNNKISTLSVGKLAIQNPLIQLCYIPALYYNTEGYSSPGSKCFLFQMN